MARERFTLEELKINAYLNILGFIEVTRNAASKVATKLGIIRKPELQGLKKTRALITGGNAGVGKATAKELIRRGGDVVLACRNREAAEATASELRSLSPYSSCELGSVEVADLDLASLASVRKLVHSFTSKSGSGSGNSQQLFDFIIANAGIMAPPTRLETVDKMEQQFQVNYLGHFLLVHELLRQSKDKYIAQGIRPRCIFLSSLTHFGAITLHKDLDNANDLHARHKYNPFKQYANSKLCQLLAAKEFHRRMSVEKSPFPPGSAVAVHPGIVDTYLARQYFKNEVPKFLQPVLVPVLERAFFPVLLKTPEEAAESVLYSCVAPSEEVGGKYIQDGAVSWSSKASNDVVLGEKLWAKSEKLAGLVA